ncbi:class A beta-lactamase [Sphingomonas sp.]|uniref:class A beta-lactamase n=1 Tax=Sphingomonas sp. TaxID=28214 RepID=UPI002DD6AF2B|nr:class A beta-lactamase [Sphingomonas sp.]
MINRRHLFNGTLAAAGLVTTEAFGAKLRSRKNLRHRMDVIAPLQALETGQARLGVCLLDTATGETAGTRINESFAMCSTFKLAMVGACLREADAGRLQLNEVVKYGADDLLPWAPVTRENLSRGGMAIIELAQAAQRFSDGTAANLLVRRLGGPAGVTRKLRQMGDPTSRLDRYEPDLGMVLSGDLRDTTSPGDMAQTVQRLTTGNLLSQQSRGSLIGWMRATATGPKRLRAGLPTNWQVGNKTGTGRDAGITNKCNDIAIAFPPDRAPIVITAYYDSGEYTDQVEDIHQAVLADVGRIAAEWAVS